MTQRSFAKGTEVPAERTRHEIETLLRDAGATSLGVFQDITAGTAAIAFTLKKLNIKIDVALPKPNTTRNEAAEVRRRWRCLLLVLKAKLVGVADGITTIEREFLAYVVTQDGSTIGEKFTPILDHARAIGGSAPAMLAPPEGRPPAPKPSAPPQSGTGVRGA